MYEKYLLQKKTTFVSLIKYIQIRRIGGVWIQTTNKQSQVIPFLINRRRDCKEKVFIGISAASKWWRFSILSSLSSCQWIFRKVSVVFLSPFIVAVVLLLDCDVFYWLLKLVPRFIFIFWFCLDCCRGNADVMALSQPVDSTPAVESPPVLVEDRTPPKRPQLLNGPERTICKFHHSYWNRRISKKYPCYSTLRLGRL